MNGPDNLLGAFDRISVFCRSLSITDLCHFFVVELLLC